MAFYTVQKDKIIVHIRVTPGKPVNKIAGIANNELCLYIKAPPEKGKANKEILKFLAKKLDISRTDIEIKAGHANRHKTLLFPAGSREKLKNLAGTLSAEE
ncbi:MAG: YggU family protein [Spirochaetales bacterium]|nr:YggU family protein [Spirochaetales bacterium]